MSMSPHACRFAYFAAPREGCACLGRPWTAHLRPYAPPHPLVLSLSKDGTIRQNNAVKGVIE